MKRQVRRNVFETNSSSMHSLVIKKESVYFTDEEARDGIYVDKNGIFDLSFEKMYFGRSPFQVLYTLLDKAKYVLASMCMYKDDAVYKEVKSVIHSYIPEFVDLKLELRTNIYDAASTTEEEIKKWAGEGNYVKKDDNWITWEYELGGVDEDILSSFLEKENITITEFLKNKRYIVIVDGDEYCVYKDMKRNGLVNADNIEKEYPHNDRMDD